MDESGRRRVLGTIGQLSELQDRLEGGDGAALLQFLALARREIEWIESQELRIDRPADDPMELLLMYLCALESVVRGPSMLFPPSRPPATASVVFW